MSRGSVTIRYKSGQSQTFMCDDFEFEGVSATPDSPARITKTTWENASPRPLFINNGEIESIWENGEVTS